MGIFSYNKARLYQKYSTDPKNFAYGQEKVWSELNPIEKASSLFQQYSSKAGEMAVGMGKAVAETGASIADTALRMSPLEPLRNVASGIGEVINPEQPGSSAIQSYQKGVAESQARPLLFEKLTGENLKNTDGSVNWDLARKFVGRAIEAPTYFAAATVKSSELIGKGLLSRILARTVKTLPLAGINTAIQKGEEGTTQGLGTSFLANALLLSGVSNLAGEIKFPKEVLNDTVSKVEKEIGTLTPEQKVDIHASLKQGIKPEDIINNLKKVVSNKVTPDEVATIINKQVENKVSTTPIKSQPPQEGVIKTEQPIIGKTAKAATDINKKIVAQGFDALPDEELAKYEPWAKEDQLNKVANLLGDFENSKKMALGQMDVPGGVKEQILFNAVKRKAFLDGDIQLMRDLANSPIASARSAHASELGSAAILNDTNDVVSNIQQLAKSREASISKKLKSGSVEKTRTAEVSSIKEKISKALPTKETWHSFVESIKCK